MTLMVRELKEMFSKASQEEQEIGRWQNKTKNYWKNVYTRFLDKREERMINFALKRWQVPGVGPNDPKVEIDSFRDTNEVFVMGESQ